MFSQETTGLFAWGSGSLSQLGLRAFQQALPVVVVATAGALAACPRRLDLMGLGDDTAVVLGVPVRRTRASGTVLAVVLTAAAVTLAGPIGFVGLFAPVITRSLGRVAPGLRRHAVMIPATGLVGAVAVVLTDAVVRGGVRGRAGAVDPHRRHHDDRRVDRADRGRPLDPRRRPDTRAAWSESGRADTPTLRRRRDDRCAWRSSPWP